MSHKAIPGNPYSETFTVALKIFDDGLFDDACHAAEQNLRDLLLPRYWQVKNILMVISCENDFGRAERWRVLAEQLWQKYNDTAAESDDLAQEALRNLRLDLDTIKRNLEVEMAEAMAEFDNRRSGDSMEGAAGERRGQEQEWEEEEDEEEHSDEQEEPTDYIEAIRWTMISPVLSLERGETPTPSLAFVHDNGQRSETPISAGEVANASSILPDQKSETPAKTEKESAIIDLLNNIKVWADSMTDIVRRR